MKEKNKIKFITAAVLLFALALSSVRALAQVSSSSNYRLDEADFDFGGGTASSVNYTSRDGLGGFETGKSTSSLWQVFTGFFHESFPGIPGQPLFTNTGGTMYNALDFVIETGGNSADTEFAIAISTDDFATTYFVQADDTIGSAPAWQTYLDWGGASGQRLINLTSSTTYKIKVKARYGPGSESGYSLAATAATVAPIFSVTITGTSTGTTLAGITTNISTTATSVAFSQLQPGSIKIGAQTITVTTNAAAGYTTTIMQDRDLSSENGAAISAVTASNASPAPWPSLVTMGRFGYHTSDTSLCIGTAGRFSAADTFAAATSTPYEISCNSGPASAESTHVILKVEVGASQPAGNYANLITYIASPQY